MNWKLVDTIIACSAIFLFLAAAAVSTNMTGIQNLRAETLTAGSIDGAIPKDAILMFYGGTGCPSGWTRVADFDSRMPKGAASYGGTGGSSTHSHSVPSHTHSDGTLALSAGNSHRHTQPTVLTSGTHASHTHTQPGGTNIASASPWAYGACAGSSHMYCTGNCYTTDAHTNARSTTYTGYATHGHDITGTSGSGSETLGPDTVLPARVDVYFCQRD